MDKQTENIMKTTAEEFDVMVKNRSDLKSAMKAFQKEGKIEMYFKVMDFLNDIEERYFNRIEESFLLKLKQI